MPTRTARPRKRPSSARKAPGRTPARAAPGPAASAKPARPKPPRRADFGAPADAFIGRQPPKIRAILEALRALVKAAAPEAEGSLKWGMPFYSIGRGMMCALGGHKAHVNLILPGPPGTYADPGGLLEGEGRTGKHLAVRDLTDLPREQVHAWLTTAAARARGGTGRMG